jgi:suppressor of fused
MTTDAPMQPTPSDDDSDIAPGWDAISAACERLYPGQEPRHFGTLIKRWMGGPDPLDGISAYKRLDPLPHWHFVSYGLSDLYENSHDAAHSGWGLELSFRLACAADAEEPPGWALNFLQHLARYVDDSGNVFRDGDWMSANGPIALETATLLRSMGFVLDPELGRIDTPHGHVAFVQVVGLTTAEEAAARRWHTRRLLDVLAPAMPLWITDLSRPCLLQREDVRRQIQDGCARDGSSSGILHTDVLDWHRHRRLLRAPLTEIVLGARQASDLAELLPLRLPFGRDFTLGSRGRALVFQPATSNAIELADETLVLHLTDATVHGLAATLRAQSGRYVTPGFAQLCWQVEPTRIRDREGHVVETIG